MIYFVEKRKNVNRNQTKYKSHGGQEYAGTGKGPDRIDNPGIPIYKSHDIFQMWDFLGAYSKQISQASLLMRILLYAERVVLGGGTQRRDVYLYDTKWFTTDFE